MANQSTQVEVSDYDGENYDYKEYWDGREYEDLAEKKLLTKLMYNMKGKRFIDIGGSFGRNTSLYADKYEKVVIMDYSLQTLLKYEKQILKAHPNTTLIAGNAYKPPFKNNSFDGGLTVRVLHHLEDPEGYFSAVSKILNNNAKFIQEIPNKVHLKAKLKWLLNGNFKMLNTQPYKQPSKSTEGSKDEGIFLNYHPKHVRQMMKTVGFTNFKKAGASYLRIPMLKKLLSLNILLMFETFAQNLFKATNIAPSIFFKATLKKETQENLADTTISQILRCPECNSEFNIQENTAICKNKKCGAKYKKHSTVWDLRA